MIDAVGALGIVLGVVAVIAMVYSHETTYLEDEEEEMAFDEVYRNR